MGACLALGVCECTACLACACCQKALNGMLAGAARFGHVLLIATIFTLAGILGVQYPSSVEGYKDYTTVVIGTDCSSDYNDTCIYRQLMYRASFALFVVFCGLAVGCWQYEYLNRSLWPLKFGISTALFVGFWWGSNDFFNGWAEFTRAMSFVWLMVQSLLLIDFGHDCHDAIIMKADEAEKEEENGGRPWYILYMFLALGFLALAGTGLAYLFLNYSDCGLGMFLIIVTLIFGIVTTVLSMLNQVNKGFLTPCIMFSYSVFMCWYALLSSPDSGCNPTAMDNEGYQWRVSITVLVCISFVVLMYCVVNGTVILNIFNPEGQGVMASYQMSSGSTLTKSLTSKDKPSGGTDSPSESNGLTTNEETSRPSRVESQGSDGSPKEDSGSPHERLFFHVLMIFFIIYATMMLTNWGKVNGNVPGAGSSTVSNESLWFKVISQWVFIGMYLRILQLAYQENQE